MKLIEELKITKDLFKVLKDSRIKIKKLYINIKENDIFYYDNLDFFLKNQFPKEVMYVITYHRSKLSDEKEQEVKDFIIDFNDPYYLALYANHTMLDRWIFDDDLPFDKRREIEETISSDDKSMYYYIINTINARWKQKEEKIAKSEYVVEYAKKILERRWIDVKDIKPKISKLAESTIAKDESKMYNYITEVIKGRWKEQEKKIAKSEYASAYARAILKKRWAEVEDIDPKIAQEAEKNILNDTYSIATYVMMLKDRWKEFEDNIDKIAPNTIESYLGVIKQRIPELEDYFSKSNLAKYYAITNLKKPWNQMKGIISDKIIEQAEDNIYADDYSAIDYANSFQKRLPLEIENRILKNNSVIVELLKYIKTVIKKRFPVFEKNLIKLKKLIDEDNLRTVINNNRFNEEGDEDSLVDIITAKILYVIYAYTKEIIKDSWPEVGINNDEDLEKLKREIIFLDVYGDFDFLREEIRYEYDDE